MPIGLKKVAAASVPNAPNSSIELVFLNSSNSNHLTRKDHLGNLAVATGPQGTQGFQGTTGAQGNQGSAGAQGAAGSAGSQGVQGAVGSQGTQGDAGAQGTQGNQGTSGAAGDTVHADITTSGSQATVDITSIPAGRVLRVFFAVRSTEAGTSSNFLRMKINNDGTSGNYQAGMRTLGLSDGSASTATSAASAAGGVIGTVPQNGNTAGMSATGVVEIPAYSDSILNKGLNSTYRNNNGTVGGIVSGVYGWEWLSTTPITQLTFSIDSGSFLNGCRIIVSYF